MTTQISKEVREMAIGHAAMLFLCGIESWEQGFEQYEILVECGEFDFYFPESVTVPTSHEGYTPDQLVAEIECASDVFIAFCEAMKK